MENANDWLNFSKKISPNRTTILTTQISFSDKNISEYFLKIRFELPTIRQSSNAIIPKRFGFQFCEFLLHSAMHIKTLIILECSLCTSHRIPVGLDMSTAQAHKGYLLNGLNQADAMYGTCIGNSVRKLALSTGYPMGKIIYREEFFVYLFEFCWPPNLGLTQKLLPAD